MGIPYPTPNAPRGVRHGLLIIPPIPGQNIQQPRPWFNFGGRPLPAHDIPSVPRRALRFARPWGHLAPSLDEVMLAIRAGMGALQLAKGAYWRVVQQCATRNGFLFQSGFQCTTVIPYLRDPWPLRSSTWTIGRPSSPGWANQQYGHDFRFTDRMSHALGSNRTPRLMPGPAFGPPVRAPEFDRPGQWQPRHLPRTLPRSRPEENPMTNERPQVVTGQMPDREPLDRFPQEDRNVIRWPNREVRPDPKPVPQRPPGWVRFPAKPKGKEVKTCIEGDLPPAPAHGKAPGTRAYLRSSMWPRRFC